LYVQNWKGPLENLEQNKKYRDKIVKKAESFYDYLKNKFYS